MGGTIVGNSQASAPWVAVVADGGDQSYGQATTPSFSAYSTAGPGTAAYTATQQLGSYDIIFALNGGFEGWGSGASGRTKTDLVKTIKGLGNFPNVKNAHRTPYVFLYFNMESAQNLASGAGYQLYVNEIRNNNWWLYESTGGTGTIVPSVASGSGYFNVNYTYAWPVAAGSAPAGSRIVGNNYGTLSAGQGPAQTAASYAVSAFLSTTRDARFSAISLNNVAPNADGIFLDNIFSYPNGGGNLVAQASWDGIGLQTNNAIGVYPPNVSSLLAYGQKIFFQTYQFLLSQNNPGQTYLNCGNFGSYCNNVGLGNIHAFTSNAMDNVMHCAIIEAGAGVQGFGWQSFMTPASIITNIQYGLGWLSSTGLLGFNCRLPATDGSSTSYFVTGGVGQTVSTGSTLEYQQMRCILAMTQCLGAYFAASVNGFDYDPLRWYDEYGDDSLTQVNVKRGWLGQPVGSYVTLSNGILLRAFQNGCVAFNGWGNGAQTLTSSQISSAIGHTCKYITGTQQPSLNSGASFSSQAMADGDGLFLLYLT